MTRLLRLCGVGTTLLFAATFCAPTIVAYSVLTHEELIDLAWNDSIRPLLIARFPEQRAHNCARRTHMPAVVVRFKTWVITRSAKNFSAILRTTCAPATSSLGFFGVLAQSMNMGSPSELCPTIWATPSDIRRRLIPQRVSNFPSCAASLDLLSPTVKARMAISGPNSLLTLTN